METGTTNQLADHATLNIFSALIEQQASNVRSDNVRDSTRTEKDHRKFELMCRRQKEASILHESYGHRNPTSLVKDLKLSSRHSYKTPATLPARTYVQIL